MRKRTLTGVGTGIGISPDGKVIIQQKQESEADIEHLTGSKRKKADSLLSQIRENKAAAAKNEEQIHALERLREHDVREEKALAIYLELLRTEDPEKRAKVESLHELIQEIAQQSATAFSDMEMARTPEVGDVHRRDIVISILHAYKKAFENLSAETLTLVADIHDLVRNAHIERNTVEHVEKFRQSLGGLEELNKEILLEVLFRATIEEMSKLKLTTQKSPAEERFLQLSNKLSPEDKAEFMTRLARNDTEGCLEIVKKFPELHGAFVESFEEMRNRTTRSSSEVRESMVKSGYKPKGDLNDVLFLNEAMVTKTAVDLWEKTYKIDPDDHDAAFKVVQEMIAFSPGDREGLGEDMLFRIHATGMFLAMWAHWAFPRIMTSHTYAAALMCTSVTHEILEDLVIQWPAFEVHVPNGMLVLDGYDFDRIRVHVDQRQAAFWLYCRTRKEGQGIDAFCKQGNNLADLLSDPLESNDPKDRLYFMAKRLVAGLLLAMQHTTNFKDRVVKGKQAIGEKRRPPDHRIVFVGAPIKVDARHEVQKFLTKHVRRGKAAPPSVQWLVRGHYRRQVVGVGRMGRKVIWIEPFWKGPEDAPILNRPKKLIGPQAS